MTTTCCLLLALCFLQGGDPVSPPRTPPVQQEDASTGKKDSSTGGKETPTSQETKEATPPPGAEAGEQGANTRRPSPDATSADVEPGKLDAKAALMFRPRPKTDPIPSYRVHVKLKSGRRFSGIVGRDTSFHQRVYAGEHHCHAVYEDPESFQLSFVDGLDGEVRLRWNQLEQLHVREILDLAGLKSMERAQQQARVARREAAARQREAESILSELPPESAGEEDAAAAESEEEKAERPELLKKFPPEQWHEERKRQIEWRRTVVGVFPTPEEAAFLEVFDAWQAELAAWIQERGVGAGKPGSDATEAPATGESPGETPQPGAKPEGPASKGEAKVERGAVSPSSGKEGENPPGGSAEKQKQRQPTKKEREGALGSATADGGG